MEEISLESSPSAAGPHRAPSSEVALSVYDLGGLANVNAFGEFTGLGGAYHVAVHVYDLEWAFGYTDLGTGIFAQAPGAFSQGSFRERVVVGRTSKNTWEIDHVVAGLCRTWPGQSYDLLRRNCGHFAQALLRCLGMPDVPDWLTRLAAAGEEALPWLEATGAVATLPFTIGIGTAVSAVTLALAAPASFLSEFSGLLKVGGLAAWPTPPHTRLLRAEAHADLHLGARAEAEEPEEEDLEQQWRFPKPAGDSESDSEASSGDVGFTAPSGGGTSPPAPAPRQPSRPEHCEASCLCCMPGIFRLGRTPLAR